MISKHLLSGIKYKSFSETLLIFTPEFLLPMKKKLVLEACAKQVDAALLADGMTAGIHEFKDLIL